MDTRCKVGKLPRAHCRTALTHRARNYRSSRRDLVIGDSWRSWKSERDKTEQKRIICTEDLGADASGSPRDILRLRLCCERNVNRLFLIDIITAMGDLIA